MNTYKTYVPIYASLGRKTSDVAMKSNFDSLNSYVKGESLTIFSHKFVEVFFIKLLPASVLLSAFLSLGRGRGGGKDSNSNKYWISSGENRLP